MLLQEADINKYADISPSSMMAFISEYKALVSESLPWHDKIFQMAKQFHQFSLCAQDKFPASFFAYVDGLGSIGIHEDVIAAFFCYLRFKGQSPRTETTRAVATLKNIWWQTKAGIRQSASDQTQLPLFCKKQVTHNIKLQRLLNEWLTEDLKKGVPKAYLLQEHIEFYAMAVIWEHMNDPSSACSPRLLFALALRLQCGSGARHKHLVAATWADFEVHDYIIDVGELIYSIKLVPTKIVCKKSSPVQFFLADEITHYLAHHWYLSHAPDQKEANQSNKYFLPLLTKGAKLNFCSQFSYENHAEACLDCAITLGLPVPSDLKHSYTSNCVRRGVAAQLGSHVKQILHQHHIRQQIHSS